MTKISKYQYERVKELFQDPDCVLVLDEQEATLAKKAVCKGETDETRADATRELWALQNIRNNIAINPEIKG